MFTPLSRSRFVPQNVCPSCLSTVYRRSNLPPRLICYNNLSTLVDNPSAADHSAIILPLPNTPIGSQDNKEKKTRPTLKGKASPISKKTSPAKRKIIEPLQAVQKKESKSTDSKSARKIRKKETRAVTKQAQVSADKETDLKEDGESIDSKSAQSQKKKELHYTKHSKALVNNDTPTADASCDEVESTKTSSPTAGRVRTRRVTSKKIPINRVLSQAKFASRFVLSSASETNASSISSSKTPAQPRKGGSRSNGEKRSFAMEYQHGLGKVAHKRLLKTAKATRLSLMRKQLTPSKVRKAEASKRKLVAMLQQQKLSNEDRKHLMGELGRAVLLEPTELPDGRQKDTKSKASKTTKRPGSTSSQNKLTKKPGMTAYEIKTVNATDLNLKPIEKPQAPVPSLAYGLQRVLFNPGVYHLRDPRSRVFNFDPYLESIMPVAEFDFNALKEYITSSRDEILLSAAAAENKKYTGSTSSMTSALAHFHFLLSQWRPVNISNLSQGFPETLRSFTQLQRAPSAIFLRWRNGTYAIDADKEFDTANILMMLGKSMEKLLTLPTQDFEKYRKENSDQITEDERNAAESFHYTTMGDFLMRSQLDAHDPRIPGTGMFDLKTRAVVSIRMNTQNYHDGLGYEIRSRHGEFESYEREYYDMIRAAFLKYSLQVRMGRMDGIFVAFHNTERIFGFQYISLPEMDLALHGKEDLSIGDAEFKLSLELLNRVLDRATAKYPGQSLRLFFETREAVTPFMYIFAEPVTEEDIQIIQDSKKAEIEDYERTVLGIQQEATLEEIKHERDEAEWEELQAKVEDSMDNDELEPLDESEASDENSRETTVMDSDSPERLIVDETSLNSATRASDEHLSTEDFEVDHADGANVEFDENAEKQFQRIEAADAADNAVLQDISRSTDEGEKDRTTSSDLSVAENHLTEEPCIDTLALHQENADTHEDENADADESVPDQKLDEKHDAANSDDPDGESMHEGNSTTGDKGLLAMTLTIRNKVNGAYVQRPENMGSRDCWSVEYALAEVPTLEQSRTLYGNTQRRRERILRRDRKDGNSNFNQSYTRKLVALSLQGRRWRKEQNDIDREEPVRVLGDQMERT